MRHTRTLNYQGAAGDNVARYDVPADITLVGVQMSAAYISTSGVKIDGRMWLSPAATAASAETDQANGNLCQMVTELGLTAATVVGKESNKWWQPVSGYKLYTNDRLYLHIAGTFAQVTAAVILEFA
jgi:hypothetical protein